MASQTLDNQRGTPGPAGGRGPGPSPGVAYLSPPDPPCQPGPQRARETEECELSKRGNGEGESSDRELERLIKQATIKRSAIIKAGIKINWTQGKKRREKESLLQERRDWCATFPMQNALF